MKFCDISKYLIAMLLFGIALGIVVAKLLCWGYFFAAAFVVLGIAVVKK